MRSGGNFYAEDAMSNPRIGKRPEETGFVENWAANLGYAMDTEMSISRNINAGPTMERNQQLNKLVADKVIDYKNFEKTQNGTKTYDWNSMADHAKSLGYMDIKSDEELYNSRIDTLKERKEYVDGISERANTLGSLGIFAGYAHAGSVDPINVFAAVAGPIAVSRHIAATASTLRVMGAEAAIVTAAEIPIQAMAMDWNESAGIEKTYTDAILDISLAVGATSTLVGVSRKLSKWVESQQLTEEAEIVVTQWAREQEEYAKVAGKNKQPIKSMIEIENQRVKLNENDQSVPGVPRSKPIEGGDVEPKLKIAPKTKDDIESAYVEPPEPPKGDKKEGVEPEVDPDKFDVTTNLNPELKAFMGPEAIKIVEAAQNKVNLLRELKAKNIKRMCDE